MRIFWDEHRVGALEKKVDDGFANMSREFAAVRGEARADFRTLVGIIFSMFLTMILGFAGIMITILLHGA
jgi:hypothetical protein